MTGRDGDRSDTRRDDLCGEPVRCKVSVIVDEGRVIFSSLLISTDGLPFVKCYRDSVLNRGAIDIKICQFYFWEYFGY